MMKVVKSSQMIFVGAEELIFVCLLPSYNHVKLNYCNTGSTVCIKYIKYVSWNIISKIVCLSLVFMYKRKATVSPDLKDFYCST